jgi:branched-chain amino acid transport system substrate-binding protein
VSRYKTRKPAWQLLLISAAALSTTLSTPAEESKPTSTANSQPIKIGLLTSLSGVGADSGPDMVNGLKLYLDEIGKKMAGRPVELIVENDESSRATASTKITKLIQDDHVDVVVGPIFSNIAYTVAPIAEAKKVPFLLPVTGADDLTLRKHGKYAIRLSISNSQSGYPFGDWVYRKLKYKKVVTIGSDFPMAWESVGAFQKTFELAGGQVIQKLWVPMGFQDVKSFISQIRPDADAVFVVTPGGLGEVFARQFKEQQPKLPVIGSGASFDESLLRHEGDDCIGAVNAFVYSAGLETPANKKFVRSYQNAYHQIPGHMAEGCYVCGMCIHRAVEALHGQTADKEKLMAAMRDTNLQDAPRGPIKLDQYDNATENVYVFTVKKVDGQLINVPIDTIPMSSQFWKFKPEDVLKEAPFTKDYPPCKYCGEKK